MQHRILLLAAATLPAVFGQTQVDLRTQSKTVDFSAAPSTRPVKTSSGLPTMCLVGELYFRTDAAAGSNLYGCASTNTWSLLTGGGGTGTGASSVSELTDLRISNTTAAATLSCTSCTYRIGEKVFFFSTASSASSLAGTGASSTVFFYIDSSGGRIFGFDGVAVTGASLTDLAPVSGITGFPPDSFPVAQCTVASNQFTGCSDARAAFSRSVIEPGEGILVTQNPSTGKTTAAVNPSYVPVLGGSNAFTASNSFERVVAAVNTVGFSATPVFDVSLGNHQAITLTGDVTSSTLTNLVAGELITFTICQDATGSRTFAWPSNVLGGMAIGATAGSCSAQAFVSYNGTVLYALSPGVGDL